MSVSERAAARAVEAQNARATAEVRALIDAGLTVLRRQGAAGMTVAEVLTEAGMSTRAFYRHFRSKDELVLAIYEQETERTTARLRARLAAAPTPRAAVEAWIDENLALGFEARRARRTAVLAHEGTRLQVDFPVEFAAIVAATISPLAEMLTAFPDADPWRDAWSIHAVTWALVQDKLRGSPVSLADARAHVLRFCLPALGTP
ncbi:MAG: helix-turn-helix domain-containing protein [Acidimicrobiia bacterium]